MNAKVFGRSLGRVALLSIFGLAQLLLVIFGCVYASDVFGPAVPAARFLRNAAPFLGFLSLFYPAFIALTLNPQRSTPA